MSTSTSDNIDYPGVCELAASSTEAFNEFKQSPVYQTILEHVTFEDGQKYLNIIKDNPLFTKNIDRFRVNDKLGSPNTFIYNEFGNFSPTTLRYINVLKDLSQLNLDNQHIVEIGAGYGGMYTVLRQVYKPQKYTFVDLPSVLKLIKRYITELNFCDIEIEYVDGTKDLSKIESYLTISNYAFSECVTSIQDKYIENILINTKHCYMIHNNFNGYNHNDFAEKMKTYNKKVKITDEVPKTSFNNVLVTW